MARTIGMLPVKEPTHVEKLTCIHCGKEYKSAAALRNHVKKEHPQSFDETDPGGEQE